MKMKQMVSTLRIRATDTPALLCKLSILGIWWNKQERELNRDKLLIKMVPNTSMKLGITTHENNFVYALKNDQVKVSARWPEETSLSWMQVAY